ncbi:hypothetical protein M378DRAFT_9459 [Amanita muscaria Koide BX008]|uniref:Uncharacterized protein n=1 Tax=Amanita muscaria (strain Koide BX008) TaxID=946122 RepID=A0A0C2WZE0_AMAMK|nr:hypothetical protein M378DRAFT_9459 [Amanita muscaria Koide BX008]
MAGTSISSYGGVLGGNTGSGFVGEARVSLLCKRVFQCFSALGVHRIVDPTQSALLQSCIEHRFVRLLGGDGYVYGVVTGGKPGKIVKAGFGIVDSAMVEGSLATASNGNEGPKEGEDMLNWDTVQVAVNALAAIAFPNGCPDAVLRVASSEVIGSLTSLSGISFLTTQIKYLVDQVVSRALAFGAIYSGGLAAGPLLKRTVNVLMSLSNDPRPVVHLWALKSLATVINAASLAYAPFVSSESNLG